MNRIKALFGVIDRSLFRINPTLDYSRITQALTKLANELTESDTDETVWCIGESGSCMLGDLIVGAYWHYTEWHKGQFSDEYAALCALGQVFSPGMSGPEDDNEAYTALAEMAKS